MIVLLSFYIVSVFVCIDLHVLLSLTEAISGMTLPHIITIDNTQKNNSVRFTLLFHDYFVHTESLSIYDCHKPEQYLCSSMIFIQRIFDLKARAVKRIRGNFDVGCCLYGDGNLEKTKSVPIIYFDQIYWKLANLFSIDAYFHVRKHYIVTWYLGLFLDSGAIIWQKLFLANNFGFHFIEILTRFS